MSVDNSLFFPFLLSQLQSVQDILSALGLTYFFQLVVFLSFVSFFVTWMRRNFLDDGYKSYDFLDRDDVNIPQPPFETVEVPYQVRQRRPLKVCAYCGSPAVGGKLCKSCGALNQKYEYRVVDRVRVEYKDISHG